LGGVEQVGQKDAPCPTDSRLKRLALRRTFSPTYGADTAQNIGKLLIVGFYGFFRLPAVGDVEQRAISSLALPQFLSARFARLAGLEFRDLSAQALPFIIKPCIDSVSFFQCCRPGILFVIRSPPDRENGPVCLS
jgi:hypothetical protein